jgi:hypothetical protein
MLAAIGVLVGTFIAATFDDPFNAALFRIGITIYGVYLLVFPGLIGLSSHSIRFISAKTDFDERMKSYTRLLGSEVKDVVGRRIDRATRDYWLWTALVGIVYIGVAIASFIAADRIPPFIKS